jgi:hypothetical protein
VITGLLLVVARLVHLHLPDTLACLASQPAPHGVLILAWLSAKELCGTTGLWHVLTACLDTNTWCWCSAARQSLPKQLNAMLPAQLWLCCTLQCRCMATGGGRVCILTWLVWEQVDRAAQRWRQ